MNKPSRKDKADVSKASVPVSDPIDKGHLQRFMEPRIAAMRKAEDAKRHKAEAARERTMSKLRRTWED